MRGYFGIGVEGMSKPGNAGNLIRSAHAFGASFFFLVDPQAELRRTRVADTSNAADQIPVHVYDNLGEMTLPQGCQLVGVELLEDSVDLPSFRHPTRAAYVLGPERGSLSPEMVARCDHIIKIPMKFCINVGVAGALVMYDRLLSMGRFANRPVRAGGPTEPLEPHVHGGPIFRTGSEPEKT